MRLMGISILIALVMAAPAHSFGDMPSWAKKNTIKKSGNLFTSICEGLGPSVSLARKEAINNCQVSAKQFLDNEIKVKTLSVETEYSVGFHQEVEEVGSVRNLVCNPKRDEVIEKDSQFQVWIQCEFNLTKASSMPDKKSEAKADSARTSGLTAVTPKMKSETSRDSQSVVLESVPQCDSIVIRGIKSRTMSCASNPMSVVITDGDKEIIVRAKDFVPKTIPVPQGGLNETIQVFLERN